MKTRLSTALVTLAAALSTDAALFVVTTTADTGPGSLRQAMLDANATPGADELDFPIGSGVATILPRSALPVMTDEVVFFDRSQPGYSGTPLIPIDDKGSVLGIDN